MVYIPRASMTPIFEGYPPKTRPKLQSKQPGQFGFYSGQAVPHFGFRFGLAN